MLIDGNRYYCLSILDKHHRPNINLEQGLKILEMCTDELKRRMPIDFKGVRLLARQQSNDSTEFLWLGFRQSGDKRWHPRPRL